MCVHGIQTSPLTPFSCLYNEKSENPIIVVDVFFMNQQQLWTGLVKAAAKFSIK